MPLIFIFIFFPLKSIFWPLCDDTKTRRVPRKQEWSRPAVKGSTGNVRLDVSLSCTVRVLFSDEFYVAAGL